MKKHKFKIIQWLGQAQPLSNPRFAVVEVDHLGPILRDGPWSEGAARRRAHNMARAEREATHRLAVIAGKVDK